ncbi:MAG: Nif3-like dinuclear metal center hexameric protein [Thermoplasmatota archaeon]
MVALRRLVDETNAYLDVARFADNAPNGLQIEGRAEVTRLATGVSASAELFERAIERGADAVIVHHGLFWDKDARPLVGPQRRRVKLLLDADVSLLQYHLPLDAHPEVGNNAVALRALGARDLAPWAEYNGAAIGYRARFDPPLAASELESRLAKLYGASPLAFPFGPREVRTIGLVSGGAQFELRRAIADGLDAFVTGEVSEWCMHAAKEAGIHFFACGHYATERLGVRALGEWCAKRFGLETQFIDVPNPV